MTSDETATDRLISKLRDPRATYSSGQVAYLMGVAAQWVRDVIDGEPSKLSYRAGFEAGYWTRVSEENAAYPPGPFRLTSSAGEDAIKVYRARSGVDSVEPRPGDFQGWGMEAVAALRQEFGNGDDQAEGQDGATRRGEGGDLGDPADPAGRAGGDLVGVDLAPGADPS